MEEIEMENEPEIDDINIFRHHPHIAKSIIKTDHIVESDRETDDLGGIETIDDDSDPEALSSTENNDKWTKVRHKRKNMRIKDFQILIPKYNSNSGTWRDARDVYENDHPGYVPKYGDWRCVLCIMLTSKGEGYAIILIVEHPKTTHRAERLKMDRDCSPISEA